MMDNTVFFVAGALFAAPGIIGLFKSANKELKTFTILVLVGSLLNNIVTSYGIGGSIVFLVCCGITFSCLKNINEFFNISLLICLGLIGFLYYKFFISGVSNADDIFQQYGLSKNYPGSMLVIFNCLWIVWKYMHYKKMPLLLPIISTIMAFFLDGRSSLICMIILTSFCFIFRGKKLTILFAIAFVFLIYHYWYLLEEYYELTRFASKGFESDERSLLWDTYITNIDFSSFFLGLDTQNLPKLRDYGGNPHNTFLGMHRRMGLLGFGVLLYYMIKEVRILIKRKWFVVLFANVVLIFRMFFDGMLVTAEDFFILTLFFLPLCYNSEAFQIKKQIEKPSNHWTVKLWDKIVLIF